MANHYHLVFEIRAVTCSRPARPGLTRPGPTYSQSPNSKLSSLDVLFAWLKQF